MGSVSVLTVAMVGMVAGCGLTLDLEPDEQPPDAADPEFDADPADAAVGDMSRPDMAVDTDLGPHDLGSQDLGVSDMGVPDLGPPRTCLSDEGCPVGQYCDRGEGLCFGAGLCRPIPADCLGVMERPVCGCDYNTYRSPCHAAQAGTTIALVDMCPDWEDATRDWCALEAPPQNIPGCLPCYDDADCIELSATATVCLGSTCTADGVGRCGFALAPGDCYYDRDCRLGERCDGSVIVGCDDPVGLVPAQGLCR